MTLRPRQLLLLIVLVAGLGLLWSAWWLSAMSRAQEMAARGEARLQARGGAFVCGERQWSGFPFSITLNCRGAVLALPEGAVLQAAGFEATASAYRPGHVIAHARGPTHVRLDDIGKALTVDHAPVLANVVARLGGAVEGSVAAPQVTVADETGFSVTGRNISLAGVLGNASDDELDFTAGAQRLAIAGGGFEPILVDKLTAEGRIEGVPRLVTTSLKLLLREAARSGSRLVVEGATARAGDLVLTASGTVELSPDGRLSGTLSTTVSDLKLLIADLERRGLITRNAASTSLLVSGLFGGAGDGSRSTRFDLRFADGRVYWGPLLLFEHPPLL